MDFETNYSSHSPLFLRDHNPLKPRDELTSFLPDNPHPVENNLFNLNVSSSSLNNPISPLQPACFDTFGNSFGCLTSFNAYDQYESKPLAKFHAENSSALMPLIDNFSVQYTGGAEILGLPHQTMVTPINMINPSSLTYISSSYHQLGLTMYNRPDEGGSSASRKEFDVKLAPNSLSTSPVVTKGGRRRKKPEVVKGLWTLEEDRRLVKLVRRYGTRKWSQIAQMLDGRIGKQCRERWHNHLRPDIKKDIWNEEEDRILIKAHSNIGNKWAEMVKILPGRTENSIKNHWNATKRRLLSRRKCRPKYPKQSSLLQEYIKTLTPETINAGRRKKKQSNINQIPTSSTIENNPKSSTKLTNESSTSSSCFPLGVHSYDYYDDVPDFNFDAHMPEETSIDSILDSVTNKDNNKMTIAYYDHFEGNDSSEFVAYEPEINLNEMTPSYAIKEELDLVEMTNQLNL